MNNVSVLQLNKSQVCYLLENHALFTNSEVKLAAKMKVKHDKQAEYEIKVLENQQSVNDLYNQSLIQSALCNPYQAGSQRGLSSMFGGIF